MFTHLDQMLCSSIAQGPQAANVRLWVVEHQISQLGLAGFPVILLIEQL